jgi:hypothetical protein
MKRLLWRYPECWMLLLSAVAWVVLVMHAFGLGKPHHHQAMLSGAAVDWPAALTHWLLMVVAMMFPFVIGPVRGTAIRSLWRRRHRAIASFLLAYLAMWMLAGAGILFAVARLHIEGSTSAVVAAFLIAALWQLTPAKRGAMKACHRSIPLAPSGWRASLDCLRYGWTTGASCVLTCGALMAACSAASHSLPVMLGVTAVGAAERYALRVPSNIIFVTILSFAAMYAIAA